MAADKPKAVILLSGGLDSATVLAIAQQGGFEPYALTISYQQRHQIEIEAARIIAVRRCVSRHLIVSIDLRVFGGSALTSDSPVPKGRDEQEIGKTIPTTYVPARNTIFLSLALAWAEVLGSSDIFVGINALDFSGYPDCRPDFIAAFQELANLATKAGVEGRRFQIHAPLLHLTKAEIIRRGLDLNVDFGYTLSCYDPSADGSACGECDACVLRLRGFAANGMVDPARYVRR